MKRKKEKQNVDSKNTQFPACTLCERDVRRVSQVSSPNTQCHPYSRFARTLPTCTKCCTLSSSIPYILINALAFHLSKDPLIRSRKLPADSLMKRFSSQSYSTRRKRKTLRLQPVSRSLPQCYRGARKTSVPCRRGRPLVPRCHLNVRPPSAHSEEREVKLAEWRGRSSFDCGRWVTQPSKDGLARSTRCVRRPHRCYARRSHLSAPSDKRS